MELVVVVAKYKESVAWTSDLSRDYLVFNKNREEDHLFEFNLPNMGRETDTFLRYVVGNYDHLPDYVAFLQGDPFDHCPSAIQLVNEFACDAQFIPLGASYVRDVPDILESTLKWAETCGIKIYSPPKFISGMQCIVSRGLIMKRSRASYLAILQKVSKRIDYNCPTGYYFEYLWPTILGFNEMLETGIENC